MTKVYHTLKTLSELIMVEQTLFALPIAFAAGLWAAHGFPSVSTILLLSVAMVGARTAGMSANRLIDSKLDAANPRTRERLLPSGRVGRFQVVGVLLVSLCALAFSSYLLNPLCFRLCPFAVAGLLLYSFLKRWTWGCHFGLGAIQACGPIGAWFAVTGVFSWSPLWLGLGVAFWMAGFDILYALADEAHDRTHGVFSVPARFGARLACRISRVCHIIAFAFWCLFALSVHAGLVFYFGLSVVGTLLVWEHHLVGPGKLERLPVAFFQVNSSISTVFLLASLGDFFL